MTPFFTFSNRWIDAFMFFLRKITVRAGERRLLLKSPSHTAKVKLLLKLFPRAQFIYIHRDPYAVFSSAVNMADKTYWYNYLATPTDAQVEAERSADWRKCGLPLNEQRPSLLFFSRSKTLLSRSTRHSMTRTWR